MRILGISGAFGHDAAAALVEDGVIVAACEQERFNRIKRSSRHPAVDAALSCLSRAALDLEDLDVLVFGWSPDLMPSDSRLVTNLEAFMGDHRWLGRRLPPVTYVPHHLAHAASSWYLSGLREGAVLVVDGQGEDASITVFSGTSNGLVEQFRYGIPASLGFFYAAMTRYLGFAPGGAGKVMGLAAYGKTIYDFPELDFSQGGTGIEIPSPQAKSQRMSWWLSRFEQVFGPPGKPGLHDLPPQHLRNAAASAQTALERSLFELVQHAVAVVGNRLLVLSGGVALNCSANGRLRRSGVVDDLFVFGAAHDAGTALGAALHVAASVGEPLDRVRRCDAFLGAGHQTGATVDRARRLGLAVHQGSEVDKVAAELVHAGEVGGWYRGRSEFGPRALGGRSIVARADCDEVRDRVNRTKNRELWRPLSPAVTALGASLLNLDGRYDFMIEAHWLPPGNAYQRTGELDGVVHADGSMRPLLVTEPTHPLRALLTACERHHGRSAIINTSFNDEREPMVETPSDALRTFASTDMDFLMLEEALIRKPR